MADTKGSTQGAGAAPGLTLNNARAGLHVVCIEHPEWGVWLLGRDRNGWTLTARHGARMLDSAEFHFWRIVPKAGA